MCELGQCAYEREDQVRKRVRERERDLERTTPFPSHKEKRRDEKRREDVDGAGTILKPRLGRFLVVVVRVGKQHE